MNNHLTEIVFILDRSGSMSGLEQDTIGGFNGMIEKMKKQKGSAIVSTILFDDKTDVIHNRVAIDQIQKLTGKEYYVRGCTALLDAVGGAISHIKNIHEILPERDIPEHTMFVITTDGYENASREYTYKQVKRMIEQQKENHNWEFLFLGANIDAAETAGRMGIDADRSVDFVNDEAGIKLNYDVVSEAVGEVRACGALPISWKKRIDQDYKKRHKNNSEI